MSKKAIPNGKKGDQDGEKRSKRGQKEEQAQVSRACESLQQLPERRSAEVSRGEHTRLKEALPKLLRVCKGDIRGYGLKLVQEVNQHFYTRTQIENARNLALSVERVSDAFVV